MWQGQKSYLNRNNAFFVSWFIFVLAIYVQTSSPSVSGGDSGELLAAACRFGIPHPPGYPLYTVLARGSMEIGKFFNLKPARASNLLNALISTCTSTMLSVVTHKSMVLYHEIDEIGISLLTSAFFTFQPLVWYNAGISEVFALNNLFSILLVWFALEYFTNQKYLYISAFVCGFGLCNQHTLVLFEIPLILTVLISSRVWNWPLWKVIWTGSCFVLGLVPYVYLYLASRFSTDALFMWGDSSTWTGFLHHLMRKDYGTFDLVTNDNEAALKSTGPWDGAQYVFFMYARSTLFVGMMFFMLGLLVLCYKLFLRKKTKISQNKGLSTVLVSMFLVYTGFFCWRANIGLEHPLYLHIFERFWMQPFLLFLLIAAIGAGYCLSRTRRLPAILKTLVCIAIIMFVVVKQYHVADQSTNYLFEDYGREILRTPHNNTIIMIQGDAILGSVFYLRECENYRRDDNVIPLPPNMMTFYWFPDGPMERHLVEKKIQIPTNKQERRWAPSQNGFTLKDFIHANEARFTIAGAPEIDQDNRDPSWMEAYAPVMLPDNVIYTYVNKSFVPTPDLDFVLLQSQNNQEHNGTMQNIRYHASYSSSPEWAWERMTKALLGTAIHNGFIVPVLVALETKMLVNNMNKIKILEFLQDRLSTILRDFIHADRDLYNVIAPSSPYVFSYTSGNIADMLEILLPDLDPLRQDSLLKIILHWTLVLYGIEHDKQILPPYILKTLRLRQVWMERAIKDAYYGFNNNTATLSVLPQ